VAKPKGRWLFLYGWFSGPTEGEWWAIGDNAVIFGWSIIFHSLRTLSPHSCSGLAAEVWLVNGQASLLG
jgi:hypothetical protein